MLLRFLFLTFFTLTQTSLFAQLFFNRFDSIQVMQENGSIRFPWAGGLNHAQFSNMDFNMDGRNDLFVFDRSGDKIISFTTDENGNLDLAPQYRAMFVNQHSSFRSRLHDWVLLRDYNGDGQTDIFTYSNGGMAIYRNDGNSDTLIFTLVTPRLLSNYGNGLINIYISPTDLPAIMDVDSDGDMDVVVFSLFGTAAEYHQNMSMETYGHADSLNFELANACWGNFEEAPSTVGVNLNISCKGGNNIGNGNTSAAGVHSGFTMLGIDIEGDGDQDLVLSNLSFNTMSILINDNAGAAHIGSQDLSFPANFGNTVPIDLYTFPAAFLADVNNDGKTDLIATPYQENNGHDHQGAYLYMNTSNTAEYLFEFEQNDFLQDNMIELGTGAYPVLFDYDKDGLKDLLVGNRRYFVSPGVVSSQLAYYRNTGTAEQPAFSLQTRDLANISQFDLGNVAPTFGDVDGDGDDDMIIGDAAGLVHLFTNNAGAGNPCNFSLTQPGFQGIDIIGQFATPCLFDVDGDSILDLVIGERNGNLNYYRNTGSATTPAFTLTDNNFGGVNMRPQGLSFGYSAPFLFEDDNELNMLVGSENGRIDLYNGITEIITGPEQLTVQIGTGTSFSTENETTPFGFSTSSGRNQYLIRAQELTNAGSAQGVIEKLTLTTQNGPSINYAQLFIKMALTDQTELNGFVENSTTVFFASNSNVAQGVVEFQAQTPIIWDGQSNLIIEFCWLQTTGGGTDLNVEYSTTSFNSNAYSSANNLSGCNIEYEGSNTQRPNFNLTIRPSFNKVGEFPVYEGERSTIFGADMNSDGLMDIAIGNLAGGLAYYKGATDGISINNIKESEKNAEAGLTIYPNPSNGLLTVESSMEMSGNVEMTIYNLLGKTVWQRIEKNLIKKTIDLSHLQSGIYILNCRSSDKVIFKRFIIQN